MFALLHFLRAQTFNLQRLDLCKTIWNSTFSGFCLALTLLVGTLALSTLAHAEDSTNNQPTYVFVKDYYVRTLPYEIQNVIWEMPTEDGKQRLETQQELEAKITAINNNVNLDAEDKTKQISAVRKEELFNNIYLGLLARFAETSKSFKSSLGSMEQLQKDFDQATIDYGPQASFEDYTNLTAKEIDKLLLKYGLELDRVLTELNTASAKYQSLQAYPTKAQNTLTKNNDRIFEIAKQLGDPSQELSKYEQTALAFEAYVIRYENAIIEGDLYYLALFQDREQYNISINTMHSEYLTKCLNILRQRQTELVAQNIKTKKEQTITKYEQNPILEDEISVNNQYIATINSVTAKNSQLRKDIKSIESALNDIYQLNKSMQEQIDNISEGLVLSRLLNKQQHDIPHVSISVNPDDLVTSVTVALFELRAQRELLFDFNKLVNNMIRINPELEPFKAQLLNIMQHRRSLLNQLYQTQTSSLGLSVELRDKYHEFIQTSAEVNGVIKDHLFWLTSNNGLSLEFFNNFLSNIKKQCLNFIVHNNSFDKVKDSFVHWLSVLIPIALIGFVFNKIQPAIQTRINKLGYVLDKPQDNYFVTPAALFLHMLMIVPLVALLTALGSIIIFFVINDFRHQVLITLYLALHLMCFIYVRRILQLNSLAQRHFSFPIERNNYIRSIIDKIWLVSIPTLLVANMRLLEPSRISIDQIGYTLMMVAFIYLSVLAFMTVKKHIETRKPTMAFWILATLGFLTPLTLAIMLILGYYYTVVQLLNRVAITLYLFFLYFIISHTLRRELYLAESKMLKKAQERLRLFSEQDQEQTQALPNAKQNQANSWKNHFNLFNRRDRQLQSLRSEFASTRSFKLCNTLIMCVFIYLIYLQWSDLAGVLTYLNNIYLWTQTTFVDNQEVVVKHLSLGKLLLAILIIIATTVLAKNLPNLLERLVLLKAHGKNKSTSYTVKIISTYIITAVGTVLTASMIGISWDNLQWLVAALSVGLGFGLQEIFGNFVAGIIILFERQLRVGDIVTLDTLSGTVRKIRIRATTIEGFDNKEVVIPNKQFITSALTNWSLSNTITRVDFSVGVAYSADINKAKELLRGILRRCKTLNRDRKPLIYVNSLDGGRASILCEVYVNEIVKRKETFDYLSIETLRIFREHGIEVPFDQLEVTIRNLDNGKEFSETKTNIIKAAAVRAKKDLKPMPPQAKAL